MGNLRDAVQVGNVEYGVPIAGASPVLYFDSRIISEVPDDLSVPSDGRYRLAIPRFDPVLMGMFLESRGIELLVLGSPSRTDLASPRAESVFSSLRELFGTLAKPDDPRRNIPVTLLDDGRATLLIDDPESFGLLGLARKDGRFGVAHLPSWEGSPLIPYARVYALFVAAGTGPAGKRAEVLEKFCLFLLEKQNQIDLVDAMLTAGAPVAPALYFQDDTEWLAKRHEIVSILYEQQITAIVLLPQPGASAALRTYRDVLDGIENDRSIEELRKMAGVKFDEYLHKR